ncbi:hypothetical protein NCS56_01497300 [Fusarium sp. Ph1]|nr:hypothetical protein NCS56_01497300 [Fusarium sp. Ph1]
MALPDLVLSGKYSDFTLVCGEHEFSLHQAIVCPRSPVITTALEGSFQEASSKVLKADEFDVLTVQHMISFLYLGEYEIDPSHASTQQPPNTTNVGQNAAAEIIPGTERDSTLETLLSHLRVNAIADYYDIQSLVSHVNSKILLLLRGCRAPVVLRFAQQVSKSTGDTALHSIIASALAGRVEDLADLQELMEIDLGNSLAINVVRACGTRIRELQAQISALQLMSATESLRNARIISNIDSCVNMARRTKECRHCDAEFACYIEKHGKEREPSYTLRCEKCRCRHRLE